MSLSSATPYLFFDGRAGETIQAYAQALGAELTSIQRFGEVGESCPEAVRDRVMHASLQAGDAVLFLSDGPEGVPSRRET